MTLTPDHGAGRKKSKQQLKVYIWWKFLHPCITFIRPVSLLPICGKIFERLIFNSLYEFVKENKLLSIHQSGFRSNDSCVNQLLSIVYNLYKGFDAYPTLENRGVFLDMSKAFDKV